MTRERSFPTSDEHGWLITPRALTSVATIVGLVYTLHAPVRYILHVGATVDALTARVATLETEIDRHRGTIAAAELAILNRASVPLRRSAQPGPRTADAGVAPDKLRP